LADTPIKFLNSSRLFPDDPRTKLKQKIVTKGEVALQQKTTQKEIKKQKNLLYCAHSFL